MPEPKAKAKAKGKSLVKKVAERLAKPAPPPKPKEPRFGREVKVDGLVVNRYGLIDIWRLQKQGSQHGRRRFWEEDHYKVVRLKVDKDDRPVLTPAGDRVYEVIVEAMVDEGFKKNHPDEYSDFLKKHGERKDDRY